MQILKTKNTDNKEIIKKAVKTLKSGGLVIFPTETLYGIGACAKNQNAINKLLEYKTRREGKPMSIAVDSAKMAKQYVKINKTAKNLYQNFLPGPLTVVSKSLGKVAKGIESETKTLGVRIPDYPLILEIIKELGEPITATSANASYKKNPYSIQDILENISEKQKKLIDLIIDADTLPKRDPSTVVDTTLNEEIILRQGSIKLTPILETQTHSAQETQELGLKILKKYKHYLGYKSLIFALEGDLGAGKTEMTKGIAKSLGVKENINSPTFIIEKEYEIEKPKNSYLSKKRINFYHIDTWRLFSETELENLDFFEKVNKCNIFSIEWADKFANIFEKISTDTIIIWIKIEHQKTENERKITISDFHL